jgi:hypothetical protein
MYRAEMRHAVRSQAWARSSVQAEEMAEAHKAARGTSVTLRAFSDCLLWNPQLWNPDCELALVKLCTRDCLRAEQRCCRVQRKIFSARWILGLLRKYELNRDKAFLRALVLQ